MPVVTFGMLLSALVAWGDEIALQPSKGERVHAAWQMSVAALNKPSARTEETLRRYDVADRFRKDPAAGLETLEKLARRKPEPDLIYALAELSWIEGRRAEGRRKGGAAALDYYVDTVAYAFDFLFDPELTPVRSATDPRFRLACDLYNAALDRLIRAARTKNGLVPGSTAELKIQSSALEMRLELLPDSPWKAADIDELILASDYEVTGLDSRSRRYGIGVPLVAIRKRKADAESRPEEALYPAEMAFPLTAVLRPNQPLRDASNADVSNVRACTIDLVDPIEKRAIGEGTGAIDIEADVTTPLAYMWSHTDLNKYRWSGLLRPGQAGERSGLMLIRPYDRDKIPVVMVHGLLSSPLAWIPMLNELLRDPSIQDRYQFLLYLYPTGMPLPIAASGLRDALEQARQQYNADGTHPAFSQMVLLGHSMGGLLAHMMALRSDRWLWQISTDRDFDDVLGPPEVLAELRHYTFYDWLPYVKCVVFLATPHHGSDYTNRFVGRLGSGLINEPDHYTKLLSLLVKRNPDAFPAHFRRLPTSIETLEPNSPVLHALLKMQQNPETQFFSIIGSLKPDNVINTTDGIVPYRSAHLDGVPEKIVRSDHGVQKDPAAIQEVRRILLQKIHDSGSSDVAAKPPR